jgi:omega-amidase
MHLFDVNIPGKITFTESDTFGPGNDLNTFDTPYGKIGLGICYDVRFYEICGIYQRMGCTMLFFPSAFGLVTGSAHWELYARTRALDNQLYVSMCSPARNTSAEYVCWGNSSVGNPYGQIIAKADLNEEILYADVDLEKMAEVRAGLPYLSQKRNELYELKYLKN